jgi:hypothetical protein
MAARVFTAMSHGTFVAVAFRLAALISPANRQGSAMAKIALGFNLANALGSPLTWSARERLTRASRGRGTCLPLADGRRHRMRVRGREVDLFICCPHVDW